MGRKVGKLRRFKCLENFAICLSMLSLCLAQAENKKWNLELGLPVLVSVDRGFTQVGGWDLGVGFGYFPGSLILSAIPGGIQKGWSQDYDLWIEPRGDLITSRIYGTTHFGESQWGLRGDLSVLRIRTGGLAHVQNVETRSTQPVLDLNASLIWVVPSVSVFYQWGHVTSPWRFFVGCGFRVSSSVTVSSSGPAASLLHLDEQYREAFSEGLDLAETELSNDLNRAQKISRWIPTLSLSRSFF